MKTISVIASIHNSEKYLKSFFENCLNQSAYSRTLFIFCFSSPSISEISLIDDFKPQFQENAIFIVEKQLISVYEAWNRCLSYVNSSYVAIWNVDDVRTRNSLAVQEEVFKERDIVSVSGPFVIVDAYGKLEGQHVNHSNSTSSDFMRGMRHGPFFMFRSEALNVLKGFDEQFRIGADFDFCIRLASLGLVGYTKELLGFYLNEGKGVSTGAGAALACERETIYLRYGIFDKLNLAYLHNVIGFDLANIKIKGKLIPLRETLANYDLVQKNLSGNSGVFFWWKKANREVRLAAQKSIKRRFCKLARIFF